MNTHYNKLFKSLDTEATPTETRKEELVLFLKNEATRIKAQPELAVEIAYGIAGFMSTEFAQNLAKNNPIEEILTIAGELEVAPENSAALRDELLNKIALLE
jgi:hypothetical protein